MRLEHLGHAFGAFSKMLQTHFGLCGKRILGHVAGVELLGQPPLAKC